MRIAVHAAGLVEVETVVEQAVEQEEVVPVEECLVVVAEWQVPFETNA